MSPPPLSTAVLSPLPDSACSTFYHHLQRMLLLRRSCAGHHLRRRHPPTLTTFSYAFIVKPAPAFSFVVAVVRRTPDHRRSSSPATASNSSSNAGDLAYSDRTCVVTCTNQTRFPSCHLQPATHTNTVVVSTYVTCTFFGAGTFVLPEETRIQPLFSRLKTQTPSPATPPPYHVFTTIPAATISCPLLRHPSMLPAPCTLCRPPCRPLLRQSFSPTPVVLHPPVCVLLPAHAPEIGRKCNLKLYYWTSARNSKLMDLGSCLMFFLVCTVFFYSICLATVPTVNFELEFSYMTRSPLGISQQVIAVNKNFPGPTLNVTTNEIVVVDVVNNLNEDLLVTWPGVQMRLNPWEDGVMGTNCPIPPRFKWTYKFQVKDQIGSFFYFPSINFQRASGGFGAFVISNRFDVPVPFSIPDGDIVLMIGDWHRTSHVELRAALDSGKELGIPDGVLINGKGPYRYNLPIVPNDIDYETIQVDPGKTYRIRVHNVGITSSLNFRIQSHNLLLIETEGCYTVKQNFSSFDIHVGQSYSFLVSTDQDSRSSYYIVASTRFVNGTDSSRGTGVALLKYSNSQAPASGLLPSPPTDEYAPFSMIQANSIRSDLTASAARPNPQGSYHYGIIDVSETYVLTSMQLLLIDDKLRSTINGISFINPFTPIPLADKFDLIGTYKLDFPVQPLGRIPRSDISIVNGNYKGFVEIVLQNNDTVIRSFHINGYSFFVVGMDFGYWSDHVRSTYNKVDGISRSTVQVYPGGWTALFIALDNPGVWNIRAENLDKWYLGEETYIRVEDPKHPYTGFPDNVLYCGALENLQRRQASEGEILTQKLLLLDMVIIFSLAIFIFH